MKKIFVVTDNRTILSDFKNIIGSKNDVEVD
ncbi:formyl transferase, partial [Francisella tularensis subsp. holarctica]|nr:formyl transferase [Francisella tularensis subsp. holarctica]